MNLSEANLVKVFAVILTLVFLSIGGNSHQDDEFTNPTQRADQDMERDNEVTDANKGVQFAPPQSLEEARSRAKLLHDALAGALLVMHRDYFRDDQRLKQPSLSLEDVFQDLARSHEIELRWLAVNAIPMNKEHQPQNDFEKQAVKAIAEGKDDFELMREDRFHFAGSIPLFTSCLKCHAREKNETGNKKAALVISIPMAGK